MAESRHQLLAMAIAVLAFMPSSFAAEPELQRLQPQGAQRGTEVEVQIFGVRIGDQPAQILLYEPGIDVEKIESVDAKQAKCVLKVAEDCRIGRHALRLRTASGLTNLMTFHVGSLKEIAEAEPNNSPAQPQTISTDVVVNGVIKTGDTDVFAVEVTEGERLSVEIEGIRLGRTLFDPLIELRDEHGELLISSDDQPAAQQDAFISTRIETAGRVFIHVREVAFRGSDAASYRLHIGQFPRPAGVFPPAAVPGQATELRWLGDTFDETTVSVDVPDNDHAIYELLASDDQGVSPSGVPMLMCERSPSLEIEPNNVREQANEIVAPGVACGVIGHPKDRDYYRFAMKKGQQFDFRVHARRLRSPLDPVLHIYLDDGKYQKGNDDDRGTPDSYFRYKAPEDGHYIVMIEDRMRRGRPDMVYALEITAPKPIANLTLDERRRWFAHVINVPQGNRAAAMMTVSRSDFGSPVNIYYGDLPRGVVAKSPPLAGRDRRVPVLFTAGGDAELRAALSSVAAEIDDDGEVSNSPAPSLESRFRQQTWLVRGRNNVHVWSHYADRPAVAVTKKLPYSVRIVEPKAPLVRGGSMELKLVAERDEGFDNSISVRTLYNPPGVSTNQSRSITKGKTEVLVPMTANARARLGEWKIVFVGRTNMNGAVECSTQLATLKIAEPYFDVKQIPKMTVRQGGAFEMTVALAQRHEFAGDAKLTLLRLPSGVTADQVMVNKDSQSATFQLQVTDDARLGRHRGVGCQVELTVEGEPVRYSQGYVDMFVDPAADTETAATKKSQGDQAS